MKVRAGYLLNRSCFNHYSYSFRLLTTEIVKYINENSFIENLAASKYSMCTERQTNAIINNIEYVHIACSEESCPVLQKCKQVVSVNYSMQRKRSSGNLVFLFSCV